MSLRYVKFEDYLKMFPDCAITEQELARAEDDIDSLTFNRSRRFEQFPERIKVNVRRAVCIQANFINEYSGMVDSPLESFGINGVSMSFKKDGVISRGGVNASPRAFALLRAAGLTYLGTDWRCPE